MNLEVSGASKTKELITLIENRIKLKVFETEQLKDVQDIINETKSFIEYGEWFIGFEIMVTNLDELNIKITEAELDLMKGIFKKANVDYTEEWGWIEEMKKESNS